MQARRLDNPYTTAPFLSFRSISKRLLKSPTALIGLSVLLLMVVAATFGPMIDSHQYFQTSLTERNLAPCAKYWFGTDELGRSMFSRTWYGARISLFIGISAAIIDVSIGVVIGSIAGFFGGRIDQWITRVIDIIYSIPRLLIVILLMMMMGQNVFTIILAMAMTGWINMSRIVRAQIMQLKQQDFVESAKALGASNARILVMHLLPNVIGAILTTITISIPASIFMEAFLSFLGLGVPAPEASWGTMVNDGLPAFRYYPWRFFIPAGMISFTLLAFNMLGDGIRDIFDPRLNS